MWRQGVYEAWSESPCAITVVKVCRRFAARNAASGRQNMLNFPGCRRRFSASRISVGETRKCLSHKLLVSATAGMIGATAFLTNNTTRDGTWPTVFAEEAEPSSSTPSLLAKTTIVTKLRNRQRIK